MIFLTHAYMIYHVFSDFRISLPSILPVGIYMFELCNDES